MILTRFLPSIDLFSYRQSSRCIYICVRRWAPGRQLVEVSFRFFFTVNATENGVVVYCDSFVL